MTTTKLGTQYSKLHLRSPTKKSTARLRCSMREGISGDPFPVFELRSVGVAVFVKYDVGEPNLLWLVVGCTRNPSALRVVPSASLRVTFFASDDEASFRLRSRSSMEECELGAGGSGCRVAFAYLRQCF